MRQRTKNHILGPDKGLVIKQQKGGGEGEGEIALLHFLHTKHTHTTQDFSIRCDEGLTIKTSALKLLTNNKRTSKQKENALYSKGFCGRISRKWRGDKRNKSERKLFNCANY